MGQEVGKGRRSSRLAEADATARLCGPAAPVGSRVDYRLDREEQEDELMDYERPPESSEAFIYVAMSEPLPSRVFVYAGNTKSKCP